MRVREKGLNKISECLWFSSREENEKYSFCVDINKLKCETKQEEVLCLEFKAIKRLGQQQQPALSY